MLEEELKQRIRNRDPRAYEILIDEYSRLLWVVASGVLKNVGSQEDIEDCIAESFAYLWEHPEKYDQNRGSIKTYLCLITKSKAIDRLRKIRKTITLPYDKALKNSQKIKEESEKAGFLTSMPEMVSQSYILIRNDDDILSFKVVTTEIKASGYETANFYNVDLKNSKLLSISDLFKENYDYVGVINNEIIRKMKEAIEKEDAGYFIEEFKTIDEKTNFYISEEGKLVIVFNEYEISAGYMGMPEFTIDTSIFKNNISDLGYLK